MPKQIFQGRNGLSNSIKNEDDKYSVGSLIDPFREWGFLKPAVAGTTITASWEGYVKDMAVIGSKTLALDEDNVWELNLSNNTASSIHDIPAPGGGGSYATYKLITYQTNLSSTLTNCVFYFYGTTAGLYDGSTFTDNWIATVPDGAAALGSSPIPYIWQSYLMIGYSQYIARFDGNTGANGTLNATWFNLGTNWKASMFFTYYSYLGVVVTNSTTLETQILLLDNSSSYPIKRIKSDDSISGVFNLGNDLIFITSDGIKQLGDNGLTKVRDITTESASSIGTLTSLGTSYSDIHSNKIYFGSTNIGAFARKDSNSPYIIYQPYSVTGSNVVMVKSANYLFVSSYTVSTYYLQYFTTGNGAGNLKYTFKDFGQKVRINYIKFYFKPLASGDSLSFGIDTDYATSTSLGTVTYTANGAITSKRFDIKKLCNTFRPTASWNTGGASISHIVVDYDFVEADI